MKATKFFRMFCTICSILLLFIFIFKCSGDQPTDIKETFTGITQTDETGPEPIFEDPDDWKHDTNWKYSDLYLALKDSIEIIPFVPDTIPEDTIGENIVIKHPNDFSIAPAYPNPTTGYCNITFTIPAYSEVVIFIIDRAHNIIRKLVLATHSMGIYRVQFDSSNEDGELVESGIYRCVYRFEDKQTGEYGVFHGHGDIQIEK